MDFRISDRSPNQGPNYFIVVRRLLVSPLCAKGISFQRKSPKPKNALFVHATDPIPKPPFLYNRFSKPTQLVLDLHQNIPSKCFSWIVRSPRPSAWKTKYTQKKYTGRGHEKTSFLHNKPRSD